LTGPDRRHATLKPRIRQPAVIAHRFVDGELDVARLAGPGRLLPQLRIVDPELVLLEGNTAGQ
jgi:hypothetical protein